MKKILSVVIAISMLLGMMIPMGITTSAAAATECATWAEVVAAVEADSAASIKLTADVTADSTIASFAGTFDGNGKTVTVSNTLFAALANGATIKNLTVAGETTSAPFIAVANGTISFTDVTTNVTANVAESVDMAAFIAKVNAEANITFTNCVNKGAVSANKSVGAFIGFSGSPLTATFTNCVNEGTIKSSAAGAHAGGFIGCLEASAKFDVTFDKCASSGSVIGNNEGKLETAGFVAFFSGTSESSITFTDCLSDGSINNLSKNNSDKYSASGYLSRAKSGTISFTNCLSNISSITSGTSRTANYWYYNEGATLNVTNSYYIEGVAASAAETGKDFTAVTAEQLASGEVAYKLGEAWGQDLATETVPVIGGEPVYQYPDESYSNTPWGQGGDNTFAQTIDAGFATATIEGPSVLTVGESAKITITLVGDVWYVGAGLFSSNTSVVDFSGTVAHTLEPDTIPLDNVTPPADQAYAFAAMADADANFSKVVLTYTIDAKAEGTAVIDWIQEDVYWLSISNADQTGEYYHNDLLGYTITVIDENGEGGDEGDESTVIDTIGINGFVKPTEGASVAENIAALQAAGEGYTISAVWYTFGDELAGDTFGASSYFLRVAITANEGYIIADNATFTINGGANDDIIDASNSTVYEGGASALLDTVYITVEGEGGEGGDEPTVIDTVVINGLTAPVIGADVAENLAGITVPTGAPYSIVSISWNGNLTEGTFPAGSYYLIADFELADGYVFAETVTFIIDGSSERVDADWSNAFETTAHLESTFFTLEGEGGEEGGEGDDTLVIEGSGTEADPFIIPTAAHVECINVPAGETYYYIFSAHMSFFGKSVEVVGNGATIAGGASIALPTDFMNPAWGNVIAITAANEDATAIIAIPAGSIDNPDSFDEDGKAEINLPAYTDYHFSFIADKNGILVVTAPEGAIVTINNLTSFIYGDFGVNTADVVAGDEIHIAIGSGNADIAGAVSVTIVPHLNIAVWTKNGDWVSADELAAMKADFIAYLEKEFDIDTSVLGIEWAELTTDGNKVADLGALVNAGNFDIIVGCGNNVDSTAGVTIVKKGDINTDYVAANRKVALLDENNALAEYLYDLLTYVAPVEIDKIDVSGIAAPEYGKTLADYKASFVPVLPEGANYSVAEIFWFELDPETMTGDEIRAEDYVFDSTKTYGFALYVKANDGYVFAKDAVITANGGALEIYESMAKDSEAGLALIFNPAPDTGDNSAIAIFAIAAVATIGCVALALRKKKED